MSNQSLIEDNINLVYAVIHKHFPTFVKDEDIAQSGKLGLCRAANTWDEDKGQFTTYAWKCIRNAINNELRSRQRCPETLSLDYEVNDGEGGISTLGDIVIGENDVHYFDASNVYRQLNAKQIKIFRLVIEGLNTRDIACVTGLHIETVRKHIRRIKQVLREGG